MFKVSALRREAIRAEAEAAERRREVARACAANILEAERLADLLEPQRLLLRRVGYKTSLPFDMTEPVREIIAMVDTLRQHTAETPMEHGLLGLHRGT